MPKLQRAKTVACGLLRWDRCCIIVVSHWSKPAGQNMASLLVVVGFRTSHSMPKEESHVIFSKNLPLKGEFPAHPYSLCGELWLTSETHQRLRLIPGHHENRADLALGGVTDRHRARRVNRVRQVDGIMATDASDGHEDLVMIRIIRDPHERE